MLSQYIKVKMQYGLDIFVSSLAMAMVSLSGLFVYWIVFQSINNLGGWGYYDIMFLYSLYLIVVSPSQIVLDNLWNLKTHIMDGSFIKYLIRPINSLFYYISEIVDIKGFAQLLIGGGCLIYSITKISVNWTLGTALLLMFFSVCGMFIIAALRLLAASTSFWIMNSLFVNMFITKIIDLAKYPISIYNKLFQILFTFLIPIGFASFYPAELILDLSRFTPFYLLAPLFASLLIVLSYQLWFLGIKKYSGTGS